MLGDITAADELYIVTGYTDMRKSIDGLCAIVEDQLHIDPRRCALYLFCGKRCDRVKAPIVLYHYTETRARYNAVDFLDGFSDGYLETDGYQGYNNLPSIRRCSCWAHTKRYFIDAVPKGKQYDYSNPAVQGVQFCSKLFEYERRSQNKNHTFEQRKAYRLEKEKPMLDAFWSWLDEQKPRKGSRFETALKYAQNRKDTLMTYLLDHRPSEDMSDEQLEALTPWSEEVQTVCKN